ncbi:MAG: PDDEXK nuclease domain-containing protein [Methanosarcinales archaeon]|jgi:predicted nuclease of restriction endonuclease-like (RecB) superfamily|nr:PDDEXK nuclease domain-containing protein [Methanosarcinales archaeon]
MTDITKFSEYRDWLLDLKQQIKTGQIKASLAVNSQLIMLYWDMGRQIVEKQEKAKWGSGFIEQLSKDLREEFPEMTGLSYDNLRFARRFYLFYSQILESVDPKLQYADNRENIKSEQVVPKIDKQLACENEFIAQPVRKLQTHANRHNEITEQLVRQVSLVPWGHHVLILKKVKDPKQALFYINKTIENNWSRAVLEYQIETCLYDRQGKAVTNFNLTLPAPQSDLANEIMKDPYNFDFLRMSEKVRETDLEKALVLHISKFLPELGIGFAYMGQQFSLKVGEKEYRIDLLFYHTRLKCYMIIELKTKEFEPEFIGKLNFYITAVNELVKDSGDKPTMGMLLCKNKDNYEVEFSLKDINNPIGVSTFHYTELADDMKTALPSAEELQNELLNFEREHTAKQKSET